MSKLCPSAQPGMDNCRVLGVVQHQGPAPSLVYLTEILPAVVDALPPCTIRKDCRWYAQEGAAACRRCPEITTVSYDLSATTREVSGLPVMEDV